MEIERYGDMSNMAKSNDWDMLGDMPNAAATIGKEDIKRYAWRKLNVFGLTREASIIFETSVRPSTTAGVASKLTAATGVHHTVPHTEFILRMIAIAYSYAIDQWIVLHRENLIEFGVDIEETQHCLLALFRQVG